MTKKNLIIGIIVLIALVGGVVLYVASQSQKTAEVKQNNAEKTKEDVKETKKQTQEQKTVQKQEATTKEQANNQKQIDNGELKPEEKIDTSDWKTYRNEEFGFEMKYPKSWEYKLNQNDYGKVLIIKPISCPNSYGYYEDDCNDLIIILITDHPDNELRTLSGWGWAVSETNNRTDRYIDKVMRIKLNVDKDFKARLTNEFGVIHHRYFFRRNNLKYLFTVRYFNKRHHPRVEKIILETFHFTKK